MSENSGHSEYNSLQISAERRYSNGFKLSVAYTYGRSYDNGSDKRNVLWNTYDDANFWGPSSYDRTHVLVVSYIYDLPFWRDQSTLMRNLLGGWQISGATFLQTGTPFSITRTNDIAGVGEGSNGQPVDLVGDIDARTRTGSSRPATASTPTSRSTRRRSPTRPRASSATRRATSCGTRAPSSGTSRSSRTSCSEGSHRLQFRAEVFNFINHPNLSGPNSDITNPNFGRIITKDGSRRDIQLALRYTF